MNYKYRVDCLLRGHWHEAVALFSSFRDAEDWAYSRLRPMGPWDRYRIRGLRKSERERLAFGLIVPVPGRPEMALPIWSIGAYV